MPLHDENVNVRELIETDGKEEEEVEMEREPASTDDEMVNNDREVERLVQDNGKRTKRPTTEQSSERKKQQKNVHPTYQEGQFIYVKTKRSPPWPAQYLGQDPTTNRHNVRLFEGDGNTAIRQVPRKIIEPYDGGAILRQLLDIQKKFKSHKALCYAALDQLLMQQSMETEEIAIK